MSQNLQRITNFIFIAFFLMSTFSSIKIKNLRTDRRQENNQQSQNKSNNSQQNHNHPLEHSIQTIQKIDNDYKQDDSNMFNKSLEALKRLDCHRAKAYKKMSDIAKVSNDAKLDLPRLFNETSKELLKIHAISFAQKDILTVKPKLHLAKEVKNIDNMYKQNDAKNFNLGSKYLDNEAKFLHKAVNEAEKSNQEVLDFPRDMKNAEKELFRIHVLQRDNSTSFVQKNSTLDNIFGGAKRIVDHFGRQKNEIQKFVVQPKIQKNKLQKKIVDKFNKVHKEHNKQDKKKWNNYVNFNITAAYENSKNGTQKKVPALQKIINGSKRIVDHFSRQKNEIRKYIVHPKINQEKLEEKTVNNLNKDHQKRRTYDKKKWNEHEEKYTNNQN